MRLKRSVVELRKMLCEKKVEEIKNVNLLTYNLLQRFMRGKNNSRNDNARQISKQIETQEKQNHRKGNEIVCKRFANIFSAYPK